MPRENQYKSIIKPNLENIKHWVSEGYSHKQIYEMLNVSKAVFYKYWQAEKDFKDAMSKSNKIQQIKLEKALYRESAGYEYTETHEEVTETETKDGVFKTTKRRTVKKYARPSASLLIFSLCNKFPEKWKRIDKEVVEELKDEISKKAFSDKTIEKAFDVLYNQSDVDK